MAIITLSHSLSSHGHLPHSFISFETPGYVEPAAAWSSENQWSLTGRLHGPVACFLGL
jgi:hypothetical protein